MLKVLVMCQVFRIRQLMGRQDVEADDSFVAIDLIPDVVGLSQRLYAEVVSDGARPVPDKLVVLAQSVLPDYLVE